MKRLLIFATALLMTIAFSQCSKRGPAGPPGPPGPSGDGSGGAFSVTAQARPTDWEPFEGSGGVVSYSYKIDMPEIDDDIYLNGAVITYIGFASTDYYEALPEVFDGISFGALHTTGFVTVDYHALDGSDPGLPDENIFVKVVMIPAMALKAHPEVNLNNFGQVKKAFSIE